MVCVMGGKWPYSCNFVGCCFQDLFKTVCSILVFFPSNFFSRHFIKVQVVQPYIITDNYSLEDKVPMLPTLILFYKKEHLHCAYHMLFTKIIFVWLKGINMKHPMKTEFLGQLAYHVFSSFFFSSPLFLSFFYLSLDICLLELDCAL